MSSTHSLHRPEIECRQFGAEGQVLGAEDVTRLMAVDRSCSPLRDEMNIRFTPSNLACCMSVLTGDTSRSPRRRAVVGWGAQRRSRPGATKSALDGLFPLIEGVHDRNTQRADDVATPLPPT